MQNKSGWLSRLDAKGFTLIELLVVVLIIGILAAVAVPQYQKAVEKSKAVQAVTLLKSVSQAFEVYHLANGSYPTSFDELSLEVEWSGNEPGVIWDEEHIKDTRSNGEWSLQLYNAWDGATLYITRLTGKYKGAGFMPRGTGAIACTERIRQGIIFDLNAGDYCEKIMKGTQFSSAGVTTFRIYALP